MVCWWGSACVRVGLAKIGILYRSSNVAWCGGRTHRRGKGLHNPPAEGRRTNIEVYSRVGWLGGGSATSATRWRPGGAEGTTEEATGFTKQAGERATRCSSELMLQPSMGAAFHGQAKVRVRELT